MRTRVLLTLQLVALLVLSGVAQADVISGVATSAGDSFQIIAPPVNALDNNVNVDHKLFARANHPARDRRANPVPGCEQQHR